MLHRVSPGPRGPFAPVTRLQVKEADRHIQAIDEARARQNHEDFLAVVDDEILPAMRAFEVLLHVSCMACRIEAQGLKEQDAFRGTSRVALHIRLGAHPSGATTSQPRLECVRLRRHPGEVLLVTSGLPGPGGTSGRMRRYDQITYGLVFDLLEQFVEQVRDAGLHARRSADAVSWPKRTA
jgi:hypothetical protein